MFRTFVPKVADVEKNRKWYVIDAKDQVLGRVATKIADKLRGKGKPTFTPHMDGGDFVIVLNADKIAVTGKKEEQKEYIRHSGFLGGIKRVTLKRQRAEHPDRIIFEAVKGMIPHTKLRKNMMARLKIYTTDAHPHDAQQPSPLV